MKTIEQDEIDDETAEQLFGAADGVQDMTGEVCPYPQAEAKKALKRIAPGTSWFRKPITSVRPKTSQKRSRTLLSESGEAAMVAIGCI